MDREAVIVFMSLVDQTLVAVLIVSV